MNATARTARLRTMSVEQLRTRQSHLEVRADAPGVPGAGHSHSRQLQEVKDELAQRVAPAAAKPQAPATMELGGKSYSVTVEPCATDGWCFHFSGPRGAFFRTMRHAAQGDLMFLISLTQLPKGLGDLRFRIVEGMLQLVRPLELKVRGFSYRVEKLPCDREGTAYHFHGPRGAHYRTMRNANHRDQMFLVDARGFGIPARMEGVWLSDQDGTLRVVVE